MPNIMDDFPSKYLKGEDVEDHPTVTISHIGREEVGKDREMKPILFVKEFDKGVVLNKTNSNNIARLYGYETDDWEGKTIVFGTEMVTFNGETGPAIRIWPPKRQAARQSVNAPLKQRQPNPDDDSGQRPFAPVAMDDDIPFSPEFRG